MLLQLAGGNLVRVYASEQMDDDEMSCDSK
jgi:hypothetical protein